MLVFYGDTVITLGDTGSMNMRKAQISYSPCLSELSTLYGGPITSGVRPQSSLAASKQTNTDKVRGFRILPYTHVEMWRDLAQDFRR